MNVLVTFIYSKKKKKCNLTVRYIRFELIMDIYLVTYTVTCNIILKRWQNIYLCPFFVCVW